VASVAGRIGVGAIFANPNPDGCRNVEAAFVAALRATHFEKIAHGVSPLVVVLDCRGPHRKKAAPRRRGLSSGQYSLGNRNVVALRSASVMIQSVFSPKPLEGLAGSIG
jgi:hypothetical protein